MSSETLRSLIEMVCWQIEQGRDLCTAVESVTTDFQFSESVDRELVAAELEMALEGSYA